MRTRSDRGRAAYRVGVGAGTGLFGGGEGCPSHQQFILCAGIGGTWREAQLRNLEPGFAGIAEYCKRISGLSSRMAADAIRQQPIKTVIRPIDVYVPVAYKRLVIRRANVEANREESTMKRDLYADVSARIIAELESGAAPWVKPWSATPGRNTPCNAVTNRSYSGCNVILLWMARSAGYRTPRFLTFKQASELGRACSQRRTRHESVLRQTARDQRRSSRHLAETADPDDA